MTCPVVVNLKIRIKTISKKTLTIVIGCLIGLILGELVLSIYNPLPSRIQGNHIRLEGGIKRDIVLQEGFQHPGLDNEYIYSTNSLGFRGPEPDDSNFKIYTVGGSTTECSLLADDKTWSSQLLKRLNGHEGKQVWLNNAGLDGSSTYGHQVLLEEHLIKLKPEMVMFLVGVNDLFQTSYSTGDDFFQKIPKYSWRKWMNRSELVSFLLNFYRSQVTKSRKVGHFGIEEIPELSKSDIENRRIKHRNAQPEYVTRLNKLIETCRNAGIEPVLITQPIRIVSSSQKTADIDIYNETTKLVALASNVQLVDLAGSLETSSNYFYDEMHYTINGADRVAEIIFTHLKLKNSNQGYDNAGESIGD